MTFLSLLIFAVCFSCALTKHIYYELPEYYFITDIPNYLDSPIEYKGNISFCGLVGNASGQVDSYCNNDTLVEIQTIIQSYAGNATLKINSTISSIRDAIENVGDLLWRRLDADWTAMEGVKVAMEKILNDYKRLQTGAGREMAGCISTVSRIMAGFLCAACNTTKYSSMIEPSVQPIIHLKSKVVDAIEKNCSGFMATVSQSIDLYRRTKMIVTDLLTAEIGSESQTCTCSGESVNYTGILNYNVTGLSRNLADNEYTMSLDSWDPYLNNMTLVDADINAAAELYKPEIEQPYYVTNSTKISDNDDVEKYANEVLNKLGIYTIKGDRYKEYRMASLSDFTSFAFALGRIFNRTITKGTFTSLYQEFDEFLDTSGFSFDEIRTTVLSLYDSFKLTIQDSAKIGLVYKLFAKLAVDFLLKPPPSAYYVRFAVPNATAFIIASYGAEMLKIVTRYDFSSHVLGGSCSLPYIDLSLKAPEGMISRYSCYAGCALSNLATCEAALSKSSNAIFFPIFRMMNRVKSNMTTIIINSTTGEKIVGFVEAVDTLVSANRMVSLIDHDYRNYMMIKYFPPHYYLVNPQERKLYSKNSNASSAEEFYTNTTLRYLQEIYEDINKYARDSSKSMELLREILRAEKDVGRSDKLLRKYAAELESTDYQKFLAYEQSRRSALYLMKCTSEELCKVGYINKEGAVVEVTLPLKTTTNPNYALMEDRVLKGLPGMTSVQEFANYSDEENFALSRCNRMFSARTLLCIDTVEQNLLSLPSFENPPDYSHLKGTALASVIFTKYKMQSLLDFATLVQTTSEDLGQGKGGYIPMDPIIVIDDDNGMDLLEDTGFNFTMNQTLIPLEMQFDRTTPVTVVAQSSSATHICIGMTLLMLLAVLLI